MEKAITKPEILAPAGNAEMLKAAVRSGADAVYLGMRDFNARRSAQNFDEKGLAEAVQYCHTYGVKVYVTINICVKQEELSRALDTAICAAKLGADGIIAADIGLISLIRRACPDIRIHGSTQMTVHSVSALPVLKTLGIKRIVLSREMSCEKIAEFVKQADKYGIETEVFVHGALCMCMSGQCLLSAMLGGRSGNRGLCAGPCRLPFAAEHGTGYDLSLKDLSLLDYTQKLAEIGVRSFKIEGRLKKAEYVSAAAAAFRAAADGEDVKKHAQLLKNVFSRSGFTDGYFTDMRGREMFGVRTEEDVRLSREVLNKIHENYRTERQKIRIDAHMSVLRDKPAELTFICEDLRVRVCGDTPAQAKNKPTDIEFLRDNVSKLGATPYYIGEFSADIDSGVYIGAAQINDMRRTAAEKLNKLRTVLPQRRFFDVDIPQSSAPQDKNPKIICRFDSNEQIPTNLDGVFAVMTRIENEPAVLPDGIVKIADIPRGTANEDIIKKRLEIFKNAGYEYAAAGNTAACTLAQNAGFKLFADFGLNVYNCATARFWDGQGAEFITLSPELTAAAAAQINAAAQRGIIAYGRLPLMLCAVCPVKNGTDCAHCGRKSGLVDRQSVKFPVRCRSGFSELLNSRPIYLADRQNILNKFDFYTLYFTDESKHAVSEIISAYKRGAPPTGEFTRGMYFRGVE